MLALLDQTSEPTAINEEEAAISKTAADRLRTVATAGQDITIVVAGKDAPKVTVPLPARAVQIILSVLDSMAKRSPVSVIPFDAELTTQQAADFLNVSRPYLVGLIDQGKLTARMVGRHRRVRFGDLVAYEEKAKAERKAAIAEMVAEANALDLD